MGEGYNPPFTMNEEITNLIVEIGEYVGTITTYDAMRPNPILRRENRIKTIHSSLAIEQNTLTLEQVTSVINGKRILGPPQDIREVKNAYEAYERVSVLDPYSLKNLLLAHKIMMEGLVKEAGSFRSGNVGVYAGTELIHAGTPAKYVPNLMNQLFTWLKQSKYHPLVKSCVFHYEFEFIHPFADGNGRTGRLWQSLILQKWKEVFAWIPVETLVYENQEEYYKVLQHSDKVGDSTEFVEFMLGMIRNALKEISETHSQTNVVINIGKNVVTNEEKIIALLRQDGNMSANMLAVSVGVTERQAQRILAKLKAEGKIIRHGANKNGYWEVIE
ncbi:Fic family protein [bacterium 0.1xD8-71]|nr:Fic family protein [Lachnospiraceae bacterium]RKI84875.1 Fic family protein [bacterium 0.1xD8-71]